MPKPKPKLSLELWEDIAVWYVRHLDRYNKHAEAGRVFGMARRSVTKLWFEGYPPYNKPPIKDLVNSVEWRAKAARAAVKDEALAAAQAEIEQAVQEPVDVEKAVAGTTTPISQNALAAAGRKNAVILNTIVGDLLMSVYKRLPAIKIEIEEMSGMKALEVLSELRQHMTSLATTAKIIADIEKAESERSERATKPAAINSLPQAKRVLDVAARFRERIANEPLLTIPADGETTRTVDQVSEPDQDDSYEDEWEDDTEADTESDAAGLA